MQATVCVTRRVHIESQTNSPSKQDRPQFVSPEECTLKTRQTHPLKQDRPQSVSPEECTSKQGQLTPWNNTGHSQCHQKRAHQKQGQLTLWNKRGHSQCHQKSAHQKQGQLTLWNKTDHSLGVCNIRCKKAYSLKPVKSYHNHQKSAQERERPGKKSLDELIVNKGTTH